MKNEQQNYRPRLLEALNDPNFNALLRHSLSPIEKAAFEHRYRKFTYDLEGVELVIDRYTTRELIFSSRLHLQRLRELLFKARINQLRRNPETRRFLNTRINKMNFSQRLFNLLEAEDCIIMADVARLGLRGLYLKKGFGDQSLKMLTDLFEKHGCGDLFS
jgi:hypothetical protein